MNFSIWQSLAAQVIVEITLSRVLRQTIAASSLLFCVSAIAQTPNLDPIPSYYQDPGISKNRSYINQGSGEHIDPFTGKLQFHTVDLFLPGNGGLDIKVQRSYSSGDGFLRDQTPAGVGWTVGFGRVIRKATLGICDDNANPGLNPVLELPDGSRQLFFRGDDVLFDNQTLSSGTVWVTKGLWKARCDTSSPTLGLVVYSPDGTQYQMNTMGPVVGPAAGNQQKSWYVSRITDLNGNRLDFTYRSFARYLAVATVSASDGRVVSFNYTSDGALLSVTDGTRTVGYGVRPVPTATSYFFLDTVTRPDGTQWRYAYNEAFDDSPGAGSIRQVRYPTGGIYDYAYRKVQFNAVLPATHAVTSKTGDTNSWTFNYTPATATLEDGTLNRCGVPQFDMTTVTSAVDGTRRYCHIGYNSVTVPTATGAVFVYAIGTLISSDVGDGTDNGAIEATSVSVASLNVSHAQYDARSNDPLAALYAYVSMPLFTARGVTLDGLQYRTTYDSFDPYGNPGESTELGTPNASAPNGSDTRVTAHSYLIDTAKWVLHEKQSDSVTVNDQPVGEISRVFDPANFNVLSETRFGVTTNWTYHPSGDILTKTDARQNTVTYSNYKRGIAQGESHPESVSIARVVDDAGNVASQTDGESATTSYSYDGLSRLTGITQPRGNPVTVVWGANTRSVTRGGFTELTTYDAFGRESRVDASADGATINQTFQHDAAGRRVYATDPAYGASTLGSKTEYDVLGRPLRNYIACPNATASGSACAASKTTGYYPLGIQVNDERGYAYGYRYRGFGDPDHRELMGIEAPDQNANVTITRNGVGQMLSVSQSGVTRSFHYNANYFMDSSTEPETGTTVFGRDEVGNMSSRQVGNSAATGFGYDGLNRLKTTTYPSGTSSVTRNYYKDDKLQWVDNTVSRRAFEYDGNKNLTQETLTIAGVNQPFVTHYGYSANDALASIGYGSGMTVGYAPDGFNRPTQASPYVSAVTHHANGMVNAMTYANGVVSQTSLNARQWPAAAQVRSSGFSILDSQFRYDPAGNLTSVTDTIDATQNRSMLYDPLSRLSTVQGPWGFGSLAYDGTGNLMLQQMGSTALNYAYDSGNRRLATVSGSKSFAYGYDPRGNVTSNGATTFAYNDAQNMTCANCGQVNEVLYQYDGEGMRLSATPRSGAPTYFVYGHAGSLLWESAPNNSLKEYVYLAGKQVAVRTLSATPVVANSAALTTRITALPTAAPGSAVTYAVSVTNTSPTAAGSVVLSLALPTGTTGIEVPAGCTVAGVNVQCSIGTVAALSSFATTITGRLNQIGNDVTTASAAGSTFNPTPQKSAASAVTVVSAEPGEGDVPIPPWALLLLAAGLLGSASLSHRRSRPSADLTGAVVA